VLRRVLGSKDEITEVWRKLHNGELYDRYRFMIDTAHKYDLSYQIEKN